MLRLSEIERVEGVLGAHFGQKMNNRKIYSRDKMIASFLGIFLICRLRNIFEKFGRRGEFAITALSIFQRILKNIFFPENA